ncbi:MAG: hypothetical protein IKJ88_00920 [Clostridia bacterium]|nr:hypothetical protein [Clostridia bacterium]
MTIQNIKDKLQFRKQTNIDTDRLIEFVNTVEMQIKKEIIDTHEGAEKYVFNGYTTDDVEGTQLIAPAPYSEMYVFYVSAQISLAENNIASFNNEMALFNQWYGDFTGYYTRNNMPLPKKNMFLRGYNI